MDAKSDIYFFNLLRRAPHTGSSAVRGKAAEGRRTPKRWRELRRHTTSAKRLGLRQPFRLRGAP